MSKKISAQVPSSVSFLVCDDIRREDSGKLVLVGFYPGELVVLKNAVPYKEKKLVGGISSLCFVFVASKGFGEFETNLRIVAPDGRIALEQLIGQMTIASGNTATVASMSRPFAVLAYGEHRITLSVGKTNFEFVFEVRDGSAVGTADEKTKRKRASTRSTKSKP